MIGIEIMVTLILTMVSVLFVGVLATIGGLI